MWNILALVRREYLRNQISRTINEKDLILDFVDSVEMAGKKLDNQTRHLIIVDLELMENHLQTLLESIEKGQSPRVPIILLSHFRKGHTKINLKGIRNWTCLKVPINLALLRTTIFGLLDQVRYPNFINYLRHKEKYIYSLDNIIGASPGMKTAMNMVKKVAGSNSSIFITGKPGTGKETIAGAIHFNSMRKNENFIVVNCGALPKKQIEDELFGYDRPDANGRRRRTGRIEQANAGTLFLHEVGRLNRLTQAKILRVIQQKQFERQGSNQSVKVDVRLICSTSGELKDGIKTGGFREDLFYRINVIGIHLPPLCERKEDIPALAQFFLHKYRGEFDKSDTDFSPKSIETLMEYSWPGNIRELENVIERALILCHGDKIEPCDLPFSRINVAPKPENDFMMGDKINLDQLERAAIVEALNRAKGVQKDAARILGVSPRVIHYKIQKHNILI